MKRDIDYGNSEVKVKGTCLETDSKANVRSDSRLKEDVGLGTEQLIRPRRKRKMKGNSLIDEKKSDSFVDSSGLKEEANSSTKDTLFERDSYVRTLENTGSESGLKEELSDSERKRKRKRKNKMAKMDADSVLDLKDKQGNSLIDEKEVSDSHLESKMSAGLQSGLKKKVENSSLGILEILSLEPGLEVARVNEQTVQSESKWKRKGGKRKKTRRGAMEDADISSKSNVQDSNEAENKYMYPETRIIYGKDMRKDDFMSISETAASKYTKKIYSVPDKQSDSPVTASIGMVETQIPDVDVGKKETGKKAKTHYKKKKCSSNLLVDGFDHVWDNGSKQTSLDHLEIEHTIGCSENRSVGVPFGHPMPAQVLEEAFGNSTGTKSHLKGRKRKKRKKLKKSLCKYGDQKDIKIETKMEDVILSPSNLAVSKDDVTLTANVEETNFSRTMCSSFQRNCISCPKKKLLVLDLNGILVDVVQKPDKLKPHARVDGKGVFMRPFCDEFLDFCFRTFEVGIWSSRVHKNVTMVVNFLIKKQWRCKLLFCWGRKLCTITKFKTLENKEKPLVLKELRKLWDKHLSGLPWKKGEYDESNTLLLDDSPYKALRNPANTAIFPYPYQYTDAGDCSLARGGDIRNYLERLAAAENVQKFVEQNPFGQPAITEADPHWAFYSQIIEDETLQAR